MILRQLLSLLDEVLSKGQDTEVDQSKVKGVKSLQQKMSTKEMGFGHFQMYQIQAFFFDQKHYRFDSLKTLPEKTKQHIDTNRFKFVYMDSKRAYFWRLLMLFYENFVLKTADFELYPYISMQLHNVLACAIAKHAADQHEDYFGSDGVGLGAG